MAKKFKCTVCGYIHEGDEAPATCPQCGHPREVFVEITEPGSGQSEAPKKGLNTNSNIYTIVYSTVLVIIVAFLLAFVSSALKKTQDANVAIDKQSQILASLNIREIPDVQDTFKKVITEGDFGSDVLKANIAGQEKLVIKLKGAGLWGPIGGYISINKDGKTVYGSFFNHESETAGLGARITEQWFQDSFKNKTIFGNDGTVVLSVYKEGKAPANAGADTYVDAITGATLTSNGVNEMLKQCIAQYADVIKSFAGGATAAADKNTPSTEDNENNENNKDINMVDQPIR